MKRAIVLMGAAVLLHSVASVGAVKEDASVTTGEGKWWRELTAKGTTNATASPSPPGPHMILTVPVSLNDVPALVDSYKITCVVTRDSNDKALQDFIARDGKYIEKFGTGVATGSLSVSTGSTRSVNIEAKVGIFLAPVGQDIEIRDPETAPWRRVKAVDAAGVYQCALYLFSGSWGEVVRYLDPYAPRNIDKSQWLPYQNGESAFPILAGAEYKRVVTGRFLPAK